MRSTSSNERAKPSQAVRQVCTWANVKVGRPALNLTQDIYVGAGLKTGRIMAKDEDVCLHCGLCAERCPTGAWDMQKFLLDTAKAGPGCRKAQPEPIREAAE